MLVSVGGAPAPIAYTLNQREPLYICFFVSPETKSMLHEQILPALAFQPRHYDWIETPSAQLLNESYRVLAERLPPLLEKWDVPWQSLEVDFTGGTKTMSVAVVLATIEHVSNYSYVGSPDANGRDKDGVGVVLDGRERMWYQSNPWDELAVLERREIALLFNRARYDAAHERAARLADVVSEELQPIYAALAQGIEGYALWDRFEYQTAQQRLSRALTTLEPYAVARTAPLVAAIHGMRENVQFLRELLSTKQPKARVHRLDILDLMANAHRRAELACRYDDAVARLYSALESLARYQLQDEHGIANAEVPPEKVPEDVRAAYIEHYLDEEEGTLVLGLDASYRLLAALDDDLGKRYVNRYQDLRQVLNIRNQSRLAHGRNPVRPHVYQRLRDLIFDFADIEEADLPTFPILEL